MYFPDVTKLCLDCNMLYFALFLRSRNIVSFFTDVVVWKVKVSDIVKNCLRVVCAIT